jgi:hypothetical protein|eukprot:677281-Prymnesium_polylepis.1
MPAVDHPAVAVHLATVESPDAQSEVAGGEPGTLHRTLPHAARAPLQADDSAADKAENNAGHGEVSSDAVD